MSEMIKDQDQETLSEQGDAGRRRLVRGVVAFAPLVLTLRSGALAAAASCTAAKAFGTVDNSGKINNIQNADLAHPAAVGDTCVTGPQTQSCTGGGFRISTGTADASTITKSGSNLRCGNATGSPSQQIPVAILSSTAVTSLNFLNGPVS